MKSVWIQNKWFTLVSLFKKLITQNKNLHARVGLCIVNMLHGLWWWSLKAYHIYIYSLSYQIVKMIENLEIYILRFVVNFHDFIHLYNTLVMHLKISWLFSYQIIHYKKKKKKHLEVMTDTRFVCVCVHPWWYLKTIYPKIFKL